MSTHHLSKTNHMIQNMITQSESFHPSVSPKIISSIHALTLVVLILLVAFRFLISKWMKHSFRIFQFILVVFSCTFSVVSLSILIFIQMTHVVNEQNLILFRLLLGGVCMLIPGAISIVFEREHQPKTPFQWNFQEGLKQFVECSKIIIKDKITYFGISTILFLQIVIPLVSIILIPGVKISSSSSYLRRFISELLSNMPSNESSSTTHTLLTQLENDQFFTFYLVIIATSLLNLGLNGFFGYGEEKCWIEYLWNQYWNSFLQKNDKNYILERLKGPYIFKFIKISLWIGFVHGLWHAPLILLGHNYGIPETNSPNWKGVWMMTASCTFLSPLLCFFT
nr:unnamed protein product [Naegleria fowleri]